MAPKSRERVSPSTSLRVPGIPCTTSSFTDAQIEAGKPRYPRNDGVGPSSLIRFSATASRSAVVVPALDEPAAAAVAHVLAGRRLELHVVGPPAPSAGPPAGQALHGEHVGEDELQRRGQRTVVLGELGLERLRLRERPGEAVED